MSHRLSLTTAAAFMTFLLLSCYRTLPIRNVTPATDSMRVFPVWNTLKNYMQGSFSSQAQSKRDSTYFDIRLRMVPIWESSNEVFYLYVEQAIASSLDKPYRQRVYKVENQSDTLFVSHIYTLPQPARFIGKSSNDEIFTQLTPDSLQLKDGCEVYLHFDPHTQLYFGGTQDHRCPSDRNGASWTTSEVTLQEDMMVSWDRGWNTDGKQVWGAEKGGYEFVKLSSKNQ